MSLKERVEQELAQARSWAAEASFQAQLAKAEASSELRRIWMETEQNMAKLEARLENLGEEADDAAQKLMENIKEGWAKLKAPRN
jgi:guanylate kinase